MYPSTVMQRTEDKCTVKCAMRLLLGKNGMSYNTIAVTICISWFCSLIEALILPTIKLPYYTRLPPVYPLALADSPREDQLIVVF